MVLPKISFTGIKRLFALALLISLAFSARAQIIVPSGAPYCPYTDLVFSYTTSYSAPKGGRIEYVWTISGASPSSVTNTQYYGQEIEVTTGDAFWTSEGNFEIVLTITEYDGGLPVELAEFNVFININASCCQDELINAGRTLTGTISGNKSGIWLIEDGVEIAASTSASLDGLFLIESEIVASEPPQHFPEYIVVEDNAEFTVDGGELRAACDVMWGGILAEDDALIEFNNAKMSDSWDGIHFDPTGSDVFIFDINESEFNNNRYGIRAIDADFTNDKYLLTGNDFDSDPSSMLKPYNPGASEYRMISCVTLEGDSENDERTYFGSNTFENAIVGVDIRTGAAFDFDLNTNTFTNNTLAGIYVDGAGSVNLDHGSTFNVPVTVPTLELSQWNSVRTSSYNNLLLSTAVIRS